MDKKRHDRSLKNCNSDLKLSNSIKSNVLSFEDINTHNKNKKMSKAFDKLLKEAKKLNW